MVQEGALTSLSAVADSSQVFLLKFKKISMRKSIDERINEIRFCFVLTISFEIVIQANFQVYYDAVMPYLKAVLVNATDKANRMLRAKAIECVSLVGMAVGKEKFGQDAKQVHYCSLDTIKCLES